MIKRRAGEMTTLDTRGESHEQVDKQKRYQQILEVLEEHDNVPLSAKEIAFTLYHKGYIPTAERNFTAPRLTELCDKGIVEPVGKEKCSFTGKTVTVYQLRREQ